MKTILDGNVSSSVNDRTFLAIQKRLDAVDLSVHEDLQFVAALNSSYERALNVSGLPNVAIEHVIKEYKIPEGVLTALCGTEVINRSTTANLVLDKWGWQQEAIERTRQSIIQNKGKNIGLIIPTGGGKTRIASTMLLDLLQSNEYFLVTWIAHRLILLRQAEDTIDRLLRQNFPEIEERKKLKERINFKMIGRVSENDMCPDNLYIIDEAHHASAGSYQDIIKSSCTNLLLTATPKRMDDQPIGLDIISFQTTYKKLFEFGCVIEPDFYQFSPTNSASPFENEASLEEFAAYILENLSKRDQKSLVCVFRKHDVERLFHQLRESISIFGHDFLTPDDIYFAHGDKNSSGLTKNDDFFDECSKVQNGTLISTSSLISEGFDDPIIDSVYVTYASKSIAHLMQTAGRALRFHEDKTHASVIQVKSNQLEYFFEKRWLYQDISDRYRPQLIDIEYSNTTSLMIEFDDILNNRSINNRNRTEVVDKISHLDQGKSFRLFLIGLPHHGKASDFEAKNQYKAVLLSDEDEVRFIERFNINCDAVEIAGSKSFLINKLGTSDQELKNSYWFDVIQASQKAKLEVDHNDWGNRKVSPELGTSWFINISVGYKLDKETLLNFLSDCVNKDEVYSQYVESPETLFILKFEEPLSGYKAHCFDQEQFDWISVYLEKLRAELLVKDSRNDAWSHVFNFNYELPECPIPHRIVRLLPILTRQDRLSSQLYTSDHGVEA